MEITWDKITEVPDTSLLPRLDRIDRTRETIGGHFETEWYKNGVVHLPQFMPDDLIERYCKVREPLNKTHPGGWPDPTPYMRHIELRDIGCFKALHDIMERLIGEPMGMHLNLTGWVSTERAWHQDDYLNPEHVNTWYMAAWIALDDIHPDSGPFQYVPGSHRWPLIRRHKIFEHLTPEQQNSPHWPTFTQDWVSKACEEEIQRRGAEIVTYTPKKGDVLLWHGRLVHRGSPPNVPGMMRKSLIIHYSGINHRPDMPIKKRHNLEGSEGYYFVL